MENQSKMTILCVFVSRILFFAINTGKDICSATTTCTCCAYAMARIYLSIYRSIKKAVPSNMTNKGYCVNNAMTLYLGQDLIYFVMIIMIMITTKP